MVSVPGLYLPLVLLVINVIFRDKKSKNQCLIPALPLPLPLCSVCSWRLCPAQKKMGEGLKHRNGCFKLWTGKSLPIQSLMGLSKVSLSEFCSQIISDGSVITHATTKLH